MKRVIVVGATGMIGKALSKQLLAKGYELVVFSRDPAAAREKVPGATRYVAWQPEETGPWASEVDGAYAVINFAGAPFFTRWTEKYKSEIRDSRIIGTRGLINAMREAKERPQVFINGASTGHYGFGRVGADAPLDENAPAGKDWPARVTVELEQETAKAEEFGVRAVTIRTSTVLDANEGTLAFMVPQYLSNKGGPVQPGTQWFSWIHLADEVGIILLALEDGRIHGPINATAPEPKTNRDFANTLGKVLDRPARFSMPGFMMKQMMGEVAASVIHGKRVVPTKALEMGYQFQYPNCEQALQNLLGTRGAAQGEAGELQVATPAVASPETITRAAVQGTVIGSIFMIVFGLIWGLFTLFGLDTVGKIIIAALVVLVTVALSVTSSSLLRGARHLPNVMTPEAQAEARRTNRNSGIILVVETLTIVVVDTILGITHHPTLTAPVTSLIVGLFFFPIALLFKVPIYYLTGTLVTLLSIIAIVALFLGVVGIGPYTWAVIVDFGSTVLFWLSAVNTLYVGKFLLDVGTAASSPSLQT